MPELVHAGCRNDRTDHVALREYAAPSMTLGEPAQAAVCQHLAKAPRRRGASYRRELAPTYLPIPFWGLVMLSP